MSSKKSRTETTNQTQTVAPPTFTAPGLTEVAGRVTDAARNLPTEFYSGPFVAQPETQRVDEITAAYDNASDQARTQGTYYDQLVRDFFAAESDTDAGLQDAITASIDPVYRELEERILPQIASSAASAGAYGNNRAFETVPLQAARDSQEIASRLGAELGYQGFQERENRNLGRMSQAPQLADLVMRMFASEGDLARQANSEQLAADQAGIDDALLRDDYNATRPFRGLDIASGLLSQLSGRYGTTNASGRSESVERSGGGLGGFLQGALGVASLAAGIPGVLPTAGAATGAASRAAAPAAATFNGGGWNPWGLRPGG